MTKIVKTPQFWFLRIAELALATTLVFLITAYLNQKEADRFDAIPATDWFGVTEVYIPDHEVGEDPRVIYDRTIKVGFQGFWVAEVQRLDDPEKAERSFAACTGSGTNNYEVSDYIYEVSDDDKPQVTLSWYMGRACKLPPGTYRILTTWDMKIPDFNRVKRYRNVSNVFHVWPKGEMPVYR